MNNVDILLGLDNEAIEFKNEKELEIKRLSKAAGKPFIVKVQGISPRRFTKIINGVNDAKKGVQADRAYEANISIVLIGLVNPSMKDEKLMEKFGCSTPGDLLEKIFRPSEIGSMADTITELSGFGADDVVEEVKN